MGNIKTPLRGISTTSVYEEGEMYSLVNLRPKNGALHPVAPRKVMQELSQEYNIVFVHQNNDYKNWIGVNNEGNYSTIYWDILSEQPKTIASYLNNKVHSVEQIGNTLSFVTDTNIYYAWYTNNNYVYLDELPQVPAISFGTHTQTHAAYYFINEYGKTGVNKDNFIDATKGLVNKAMDLLMNGGTINEEHFEGYGLQLFDACFVRYAFRLYDGTITKQSPPILAMPVKDILEYKTIDYMFLNGRLAKHSKVDVYGYKLAMGYDLSTIGNSDHNQWKDIIKSVDVFMSLPIGISNIENMRKDLPTKGIDVPSQVENDVDNDLYPPTSNLIKEITTDALKNVANTSTFYLVRSIELGKYASPLDPDILPSQDSDFTKMENLIYQEVMADDNFSNHKYGASTSYVYNNRLHLGNIKTTFFNGFNINYFKWRNDYNGITPPEGRVSYIAMEVEIYTGSFLDKVYSFYSEYTSVGKLFSSAFLSYPDTRAKRIIIYEVENNVWTRVFTAPLEPHKLLNLAYFVNEGLKPIVKGDNAQEVNTPDTSRKATQSDPNKIKVSELNNPLSFPNINTYQAGNGTVLAMASNAIRISEGQFGQFPLYVFTTQGIYSLDVGQGEVVYSSKSAPTSYEIPTTSIVASTPFGVVFTSARGVCIIRGQEVDLLTLPLQENPRKLNIEYREPMVGIILDYSKPLNQYLESIDNLIYDPHENELIISDKESEFNYVLNFYSQSFYQYTEKIDLVVGNTYPQLNIVGNNQLKDFQHSAIDEDGNPARVDVSFITRSLQFGNPYIKWLEEVLLFATLYDTDRLRYTVHASREGVDFQFVNAKGPTKRDKYTHLDQGRIPGNKFSNFLFTFGARVAPESWIEYFNSIVTEEYPRRLTR